VGRSVAEVESAGAVEGLLGGAGWVAAEQDRLLVVVGAGAVDGKAPPGIKSTPAVAHGLVYFADEYDRNIYALWTQPQARSDGSVRWDQSSRQQVIYAGRTARGMPWIPLLW
jgi:hypothetical protein